MAQPLTNILALDFSAATGEAGCCCTVVKSSTEAASDDHFAKRGVYGWQVQIGTGACPPCAGLSRAASRDEAASGLGCHNRDFGPAAP
ncbi:hypothetical protein [uncultured Bradyrhizobium sp.]|uniref:hypothetical protein n=1 Tax=uncultured Bradyrhizobium sp. TaxID=199684 RepID=UPI00261ACAAA|nr:hypothetical protein [uncultured Bradyrhizobium sp.]